ncbi:MAG TPA: glycine--tRNA ligase subunit beta [Sandaracinaceae bacterium LLY-WYZ-13_1]|nr:glycine--tRNA ligase subunit beta [Sandaracinaceae bacterium LLY-WYZ-13_1]
MSRPLLLEIGVEELPASFVSTALEAMPRLATDAFARARLAHGEVRALGTPRRLTLVVEWLADRQEDLSEKVVGPPKAAAFAEDGTPKKAAEGFAKKLGVSVEALTIEQTDKGPYVTGMREEEGRPADSILPELLGALVPKIPFPKSMRWGPGEVAFGRPVHWICCLHDEEVVEVEFAGVRADRRTRGHRFLADREYDLKHADEYVDTLREAHVLVVPEERRRVMNERLAAAAKGAGGELVEDAFLVEENMSLVEEPHVICGSFDEAFLELPDEVTIEVMRGHQRYFALRADDGRLLPRYLAVVNTNEAPEIITKGNDRVLRARLADAEFFVREDLERSLDAMVDGLRNVVFQAKLGTVFERVDRFQHVLDDWVTADEDDLDAAEQAARLSKADLVSLIVGEFPELQGTMGRWYAEKAGVGAAIARAVEEHYRPRGASDEVPATRLGAHLAVVERADALVGCFGIGLIPTGSADPFALRRATLGMIRVALEGPIDVDVARLLGLAWDAYHHQHKPVGSKAEVLDQLDEFFRGRLRAFLGDRAPTDLVDACLGAWDGGSLRDLDARLRALEAFRRLPAYESLAVAFKRAHNITKDAPDGAFDAGRLTEDAEKALARRWASVRARIAEATAAGRYTEALTLVAEELREPIDRFFDEVFVMVDDEAVRDNRLRLLADIARTLSAIAHFHLLGDEADPS